MTKTSRRIMDVIVSLCYITPFAFYDPYQHPVVFTYMANVYLLYWLGRILTPIAITTYKGIVQVLLQK